MLATIHGHEDELKQKLMDLADSKRMVMNSLASEEEKKEGLVLLEEQCSTAEGHSEELFFARLHLKTPMTHAYHCATEGV